MSLIEKIDAEIAKIYTDEYKFNSDKFKAGKKSGLSHAMEIILSEQKELIGNTEQLTEVTTVKELIDLLLKSPQGNIILADIGQEESAEVTDVLIGSGTARGITYLKIKPYEEQKEPCEYCKENKCWLCEFAGECKTVKHCNDNNRADYKPRYKFCHMCGRDLNQPLNQPTT